MKCSLGSANLPNWTKKEHGAKMMPDVALFSQKSTGCSHGSYVDIVEVLGSIPSTPTIFSITYDQFTLWPRGPLNLRTTYAKHKKQAEAVRQHRLRP